MWAATPAHPQHTPLTTCSQSLSTRALGWITSLALTNGTSEMDSAQVPWVGGGGTCEHVTHFGLCYTSKFEFEASRDLNTGAHFGDHIRKPSPAS